LNVAVRNEERRIPVLLGSIAGQSYPKEKIEVLVIDGESEDSTVQEVRRYVGRLPNLKVIENQRRDPASGRTLGLLNATGRFHMYLDADMEFSSPETLQMLVQPLVDGVVVGSFTRLLSGPRDSALNGFLSYSPFQHDPLLELLSSPLEATVIRSTEDYDFCRFTSKSLPLVGVIMFPTALVREIYTEMKSKWPEWFWADLDFPAAVISHGHHNFAYAKRVGIYHHSFTDIRTLLRKKRRDMTWSFLTTLKYRYATYINFDSKRDVVILFAITVYSLTLAFPIFKGVQKAIKFRDWKCLFYHPLLAWILTNYLIALMVTDKRGRTFITKLFRTLLGFSGVR
jgi:glycosyltransferase involved in cell wall biosynthesis